MFGQGEYDAGSRARHRFDRDIRADALGSFAHDPQSDMRIVMRGNITGETTPIVADAHAPARFLLHVEPHLSGVGVLAYVRERFLHDMQDLYLNVGGQRHAVAFNGQTGFEFRLVLEFLQRGAQRGNNVFATRAGSEIQ